MCLVLVFDTKEGDGLTKETANGCMALSASKSEYLFLHVKQYFVWPCEDNRYCEWCVRHCEQQIAKRSNSDKVATPAPDCFGASRLVMTKQDGDSVTSFRVKHLIHFRCFIDKLVFNGPPKSFGKAYRRLEAGRLYVDRLEHRISAELFHPDYADG
jgi:hypothetical protein